LRANRLSSQKFAKEGGVLLTVMPAKAGIQNPHLISPFAKGEKERGVDSGLPPPRESGDQREGLARMTCK
jgi:hypothetical protein